VAKSNPDSPPKFTTKKDIAIEYGIPTRDILTAMAEGLNFPRPVQLIGRERRFYRGDIARYFKDRPSDRPPG
jgi:predicted DNA-binding transcriptional regulator AlpA